MSTGSVQVGGGTMPPPAPRPTGRADPTVATDPYAGLSREARDRLEEQPLSEIEKAIRFLEERPLRYPNQERAIRALQARAAELRAGALVVDPELREQRRQREERERYDRETAFNTIWPNTWFGELVDDVLSGAVDDPAASVVAGVPSGIILGSWPGRVVNVLFPGGPANSGGDVLSDEYFRQLANPPLDPRLFWVRVWLDWVANGVFVPPQWVSDP